MLQTDIIFAPALETLISFETMNSDKNATPEPEVAEPKPGYVKEYQVELWSGPAQEEVEAVQVFARRLVEDYATSRAGTTGMALFRGGDPGPRRLRVLRAQH